MSFSQCSAELQDDSTKGVLGSKFGLTLTAEVDEVRTTRFNDGFFLQERMTLSVPSVSIDDNKFFYMNVIHTVISSVGIYLFTYLIDDSKFFYSLIWVSIIS